MQRSAASSISTWAPLDQNAVADPECLGSWSWENTSLGGPLQSGSLKSSFFSRNKSFQWIYKFYTLEPIKGKIWSNPELPSKASSPMFSINCLIFLLKIKLKIFTLCSYMYYMLVHDCMSQCTCKGDLFSFHCMGTKPSLLSTWLLLNGTNFSNNTILVYRFKYAHFV